MRPGEGDLSSLKSTADAFPVPAGVGPGTGTIGSQRAVLSDDDVEKCIRAYVWNLINFTGSDIGGTPPTTQRAVDILSWISTNAALNSGKGPQVSCGTAADLYVGLMSAYGIPARRVWVHKGPNTDVDVSAEYWSPSVPGWVHVAPYINGITKWTASGIGASLLDSVTVARQLGTRVGTIDTTATANPKSGIYVDLSGYYDFAVWGRGDRLQFSGGSAGDPWVLYQGNRAGCYVAVLPQTANCNAGKVAEITPFTTQGVDISDITYSPTALSASARLSPGGLVEVALNGRMLDAGPTFQVKVPSGSWTALTTPAHTFLPVAGTWQYRMVGARGNTSNVVSVTVA